MIRRSLLIALLSLLPCVAHAEHERPTFEWHDSLRGAWSPYRNGGEYVLAGGNGRKWQVDFTALRVEGEISRDVTAAGDHEERQFDADGRVVIAGVSAGTGVQEIYRSSDGDITWTASGFGQGTVGADALSSGRVSAGPGGLARPLDYAGGGFIGAKLECEIDSHAVVCGLAISSKSGLQGGLGYGAYDTSPIAISAVGESVTLRLSPYNLFPGEGSTADVTIDLSDVLRDGKAAHDCFQRHFPVLTRGFDAVARAVTTTWARVLAGVPSGPPATAGFGDDVGRFAETRPLGAPTADDAPNAGFNRGANWLAR